MFKSSIYGALFSKNSFFAIVLYEISEKGIYPVYLFRVDVAISGYRTTILKRDEKYTLQSFFQMSLKCIY